MLIGKNKMLPDGSVIALNGEAGWQADTLPPGVYVWLWPWQYEVEFQEFIEVKDGQLGVIDAIDGIPLTKVASSPRRWSASVSRMRGNF